jgi:hypothetical protein
LVDVASVGFLLALLVDLRYGRIAPAANIINNIKFSSFGFLFSSALLKASPVRHSRTLIRVPASDLKRLYRRLEVPHMCGKQDFEPQ